ncbi:MAG: DUF896 domain-containing protein [Oscillospiraceae bacterium]|jgi:uncharacterized protein YnzC (UPF0291/DUF896 family)|nr:DUF896 domain-containing protein [Oscillospiraceae bacterium]
MNKEDILRINELAKKQKAYGLNKVEEAEQASLRRQYIAEFRASMQATLDSVLVEQADGTYEPLEKKVIEPDKTAKIIEERL